MIKIEVSEELMLKVKDVILSCIECDVTVEPACEELNQMVEDRIRSLASSLKLEDISHIPAIQSSRKAYKTCGKDPARYRLSAEALLRRIVRGIGIYTINNVVDILNFVSVSSGYSIGGYDADRIEGDVVFGTGIAGETYVGVGRGLLNIEGLPVFRDRNGAFGSPTSDSERTSVTESSKKFLMVIIGFGSAGNLEKPTELAVNLLKKYAGAEKFEIQLIK